MHCYHVVTKSDDEPGNYDEVWTLGWRLVQLLAAQLHGTLTVEHAAGTTVTLTFAPGPTAEGCG